MADRMDSIMLHSVCISFAQRAALESFGTQPILYSYFSRVHGARPRGHSGFSSSSLYYCVIDGILFFL